MMKILKKIKIMKTQNAIGSAGSGGAVTVIGAKDAGGATLSLDIPSGVTVVWKANYSGAVDNPSVLIELSGVGTFEVAQSGSIRNNDNGFAIRNDTSKCTIAVSGGTVSAAVNTIKARGNISVSGGTVSADGGGWTIEGYGPSDTAVTVSGGSVIGGNNGDAIRAFDGIKVIISGGTVSGNGSNGVTILISGESSVTVVAARWNPRKTKLSTV